MSNPRGTTAYPLQWPNGRPRTPQYQIRPSKFEPTSFAVARDNLLAELKRLGARNVVLSTNTELRQDGLPYSGRRQPDDCGVAVYFTDRKQRQMALACDRWKKIEDNLRAITKTIEALRGIERWGSGEMLDAAFTGFAALPPSPQSKPWHEVLGVMPKASFVEVNDAYRRESLRHHPDRGGSTEAMTKVNAAYEQFKKERGMT